MNANIFSHLKNHSSLYGCLAFTLALSFFIFYYSFQFQVWTSNNHWVSDVPRHAEYVQIFYQKHAFPAYSLWFKIINILSGFTLNETKIAYVTIAVLSILIAVKYLFSYEILRTNTDNKKLAAWLSLILIIAMPILTYEKYIDQASISNFHVFLGNLPPNQWHNSTLILAMPLSILLFYYAVTNFNAEKYYPFLMMGCLSVLGILCKPNYALAFLPIYCGALFIHNLRNQDYKGAIIKTALVGGLSILALIYQWYFTYIDNTLFEHPTKTIFAPLLTWRMYSPHALLSSALSALFPFVVLVFYFKKIDRYLVFSWLIFLVSLLTFALLAEYPEASPGNFGWGAIAANNILFIFTARFLIAEPIDSKAQLSYFVLALHFFSGLFLLASFFIKQKSLIL